MSNDEWRVSDSEFEVGIVSIEDFGKCEGRTSNSKSEKYQVLTVSLYLYKDLASIKINV